MGKVLVITSGKGGTGKSTFAVGLGAALCRRMRNVLLIDMDQGLRSLDSMLGLTKEMAFDIGDVIAQTVPVSKAVLKVDVQGGLYLLGAPQRPGSITQSKELKELCDALTDQYDYVILDSPAGVGKGFDIAVSAAQTAIIVSGSDPVSIRDAGLINRLLMEKEVSERRLVINRIKVKLIRGGILPNVDASIDQTGLQLLGLIPEDGSLLVCAAKGIPPYKGKAVAAFDRIAERIEGKDLPLPRIFRRS